MLPATTTPHTQSRADTDWTLRCVGMCGGLAVAAGVLRAVIGLFSVNRLEGLDATTLTYFAVGGALFLAPRLKTLAFGDYKVELDHLRSAIAETQAVAGEATEEAKTATSMARALAQPTEPAAVMAEGLADAWERAPGAIADDPWKGVFGEQRERDGVRLLAKVDAVSDQPGWFRVHLWVAGADSTAQVLPDHLRVRFFIHPTFATSKVDVRTVGGRAELRLHAWGAFTVGALVGIGTGAPIALEYDLALDGAFPALFRSR
jgi:hypothetical protein